VRVVCRSSIQSGDEAGRYETSRRFALGQESGFRIDRCVAMRVEGGDGRIGLNQSAMRWLPIVGLAGTTNSKTIFHTRVAGPNARCLGLLRARYSSRETEVGVIYHSGGGGRCGIQYLYRNLMHIAATHSLSAVMRREWQTSM
jgi:hypothetical protein